MRDEGAEVLSEIARHVNKKNETVNRGQQDNRIERMTRRWIMQIGRKATSGVPEGSIWVESNSKIHVFHDSPPNPHHQHPSSSPKYCMCQQQQSQDLKQNMCSLISLSTKDKIEHYFFNEILASLMMLLKVRESGWILNPATQFSKCIL